MRLAILLALFFQLPAPIILQHPNPSLVSGEISYWSCPKGWAVSYRSPSDQLRQEMPSCIASHLARALDLNMQELIFWKWKKTIPKSGVLQGDWSSKKWIGLPGCDITGDAKDHLLGSPERTKDHITVRGKSGQELVFTCMGVAERN